MAQVANKSGGTDEEDGCGETRVDRGFKCIFTICYLICNVKIWMSNKNIDSW